MLLGLSSSLSWTLSEEGEEATRAVWSGLGVGSGGVAAAEVEEGRTPPGGLKTDAPGPEVVRDGEGLDGRPKGVEDPALGDSGGAVLDRGRATVSVADAEGDGLLPPSRRSGDGF